jgi:hypothetical protein
MVDMTSGLEHSQRWIGYDLDITATEIDSGPQCMVPKDVLSKGQPPIDWLCRRVSVFQEFRTHAVPKTKHSNDQCG